MNTVDYLRLSRRRHNEGHLPFRHQVIEMAYLRLFRGVSPGYYHVAGFWRKDIPWTDKINHTNHREYNKYIDDINPPQYHKLSQNKIVEKGILSLFDIPRTQFLGYLHPLRGYDHKGRKLTGASDLRERIVEWGVERLCFKLVEGWSGRGFRAVDVIRDGEDVRLRPLADTETSIGLDDYCEAALRTDDGNGLLIEEYLRQHPWYAALNPSSVNTLRLWVVQLGDRPAETRMGFLRMGRNGSLVDNQSAGGIVAHLDIRTGVLGAGFDGLATRNAFPVHPDSGTPIEGAEPPMLAEAMALAEKCVECLPNIRFAGLDVGFSDDGPVIIETNVKPDREDTAYGDVPAKHTFRPA